MTDEEYDLAVARVLKVAPNDTTFEDGMRIFEFLTSCTVMSRQAENEQPTPDLQKFARRDATADGFVRARAELIALWKIRVPEQQPLLREYSALISENSTTSQ
jgi:hypothetical protein